VWIWWLSLRPVNFVLGIDPQLFTVARFPVAQIGFPEYVGRLQRPAQFRLVRETHPHVHYPFLENVFGPIHDLAVDSGILLPRPG
jgi:hypothetical protein